MSIRRFFGTKAKERQAAILEMMKNYMNENIADEDVMVKQAEIILHEDFNLRWRKAEKIAKRLVDELWFRACFELEADTEEAQAYYDAHEGALSDAKNGRW